MHRTLALQKGGRGMVSTAHGQRRILKRLPPLLEYIEKAVETGVYRTNDEINAAMKAIRRGDRSVASEGPEVAEERFRRDIIRGTQVQEYPSEYHILKLHPPIPPPPRIPKKHLRRMQAQQKKHPTEKLAANYLKRQPKPKATKEDYYRRLLGVEAPTEDFAMAHKSAAVSKAYAYAVKQYEVMRTQDVSETEALKIVDELLAKETRQEAQTSRAITNEMKDWAEKKSSDEEGGDSNDVVANLPSILHNKPRVVEGMLQWSRMLQQSGIPYKEWTVGASTALDHWIARNILDLSEATWQELLEGDNPSLLSRGQDIVAVRETLFPETSLDVDESSDAYLQQKEEEERERDERAAKSIAGEGDPQPRPVDELIRSLRGMEDEPEEEPEKEEEQVPDFDKDEIQMLTDELQEWRTQNAKTPYSDWSQPEKDRFSAWLKKYLDILTTEVDRPLIDLDETREALLSSPPVSHTESESFWSSLQDETKAEIFLQHLLKKGPPEGLSDAEKAFWSMPYEDQLERLVNLGAVRPLLDEYMKESERVEFMRLYGDFLLEGVELEHLVPDPDGAISGSDLGVEAIRAWNIQRDDRFRLVKLPYNAGVSAENSDGETGSDLAMEQSRALYHAWNKQKAGRARYEEQMFVQGDLGLSYTSKTANEKQREREELLKHKDESDLDKDK